MWFIIIIALVIIFILNIHDITGDWVDVTDGHRYTVYPASIVKGHYITQSQKDSYAIKYDFLSGLINTTHGKRAQHHALERKIQWPRQTWYKVMDSKGAINFSHEIISYPNLFGMWHGITAVGEPVFLQFKMKNFHDTAQKHHCVYDVIVKIYDEKKKKHKYFKLHGDPITKNKIKLHGKDFDDIEVYWDHTNKLTGKVKNQYITMTKVWVPDDFNLSE